jgi:polygalacturonase
MASATLTSFLDGATVNVYAVDAFGVRTGSSLASGTQSGASITISNTSLADATKYAATDGTKTIRFMTNPAASTTTTAVGTDATASPYYADKTGVADATAAIQAALTAVGNAGGGVVRLPAGDYKISSANLTLPAKVSLVGEGQRATRILQAYWSSFNPIIEAAGSISATNKALTGDVVAGATTLPIPTTGVAAGDFLHLGSDTPFSSDALRYKGEIVRVKTVDSASQVTIYGYLHDDYTTATSASAKVLTFAEGVTVRDLAIVNTEPNAHTAKGLRLRYCRDFRVERVRTEGMDGAGITIKDSIDGVLHANTHFDHSDVSGSSRYGYGTALINATQNIVVSDLVARKVRHALTTDAEDNERGVVRNVVVIGGVASHTSDGAWDTHYNSENITFVGCKAHNCSFFGFQFRAKNMRVQSGDVTSCEAGALIFDAAHGAQIIGTSFRKIVEAASPSASYGHGVRVGLANDVVISGNVFDNIARRGITIAAAAKRLQILDNTIKNCGVANVSGYKGGVVTDGSLTNAKSGLLIDGNRFMRDNSVSTAMDYGIRQNSTGWADGLFSNNVFQSMALGTILDSGSVANSLANNTTGPVVN